MSDNELFNQTEKQSAKIQDLLRNGRRDVPDFYDEEDIEIIDVPVEGGTIRAYHHKPKNSKCKRPLIFLSGYIAAASTWVDFHKPHQGICEYYYLESREKKSSTIKRRRKYPLSLNQAAIDLGIAIKYLGLDKRDYILVGASYGGGIILKASIMKLVNPSTTITFDPITKWVYTKKALLAFLMLTPGFILGFARTLLAKLYLRKMKNQAQRRRMIAFVKEGDPWKFKKATWQNRKLNFFDELKKIENEIFIVHGPLDKYHPRMDYYKFAKEIPNGRFIFMDTADEDRELLAGVVATAFARVTKEQEVPESIAEFEIKVKRD